MHRLRVRIYTATQVILNPKSEVETRPYGSSEVIQQSGAKASFLALERERPQIVNNFATSASPGYELASSSIG